MVRTERYRYLTQYHHLNMSQGSTERSVLGSSCPVIKLASQQIGSKSLQGVARHRQKKILK